MDIATKVGRVKPNVEGSSPHDRYVDHPVCKQRVGAGSKIETRVDVIQVSVFAYIHAVCFKATTVVVAFVSVSQADLDKQLCFWERRNFSVKLDILIPMEIFFSSSSASKRERFVKVR